MPIPRSPEEWSAITPGLQDGLVAHEWYATCDGVPVGVQATSYHLRAVALVAAAARLLERERCVKALADYWTGPTMSDSEAFAEARRILEVET